MLIKYNIIVRLNILILINNIFEEFENSNVKNLKIYNA